MSFTTSWQLAATICHVRIPDCHATSPAEELAPYRAISRSAVISAVLAAISLPLVVLAVVSMRFQVGDAVPLGFVGAFLAVLAFILGVIGARADPPLSHRIHGRPAGQNRHDRRRVAGHRRQCFGVPSPIAPKCPTATTASASGSCSPIRSSPSLPIAPKAIELTGKPIFIKGYMHPGVASMGKVNHFILVPDMGTCCFGGQPKPTRHDRGLHSRRQRARRLFPAPHQARRHVLPGRPAHPIARA